MASLTSLVPGGDGCKPGFSWSLLSLYMALSGPVEQGRSCQSLKFTSGPIKSDRLAQMRGGVSKHTQPCLIGYISEIEYFQVNVPKENSPTNPVQYLSGSYRLLT